MLTAVIARSPVFGGQVVSFKGEEAKAVPGVVDLVQVSSGIAVVANGFWAARQGLDKLQVTWNEGQWAELDTSRMRKEYAKLSATPGAVARKEGDAAIAIGKAAKKLAAEYEVPYLAHAALEPLNIVVDLRKDACDIWTGNQCQTDIRDTAARISGLKPEQVAVHTPFVGGGFGRKASFGSPWTIEAVELAKALKKPVKVIWTREDDIQGGYYRPMWSDRIAAGLDDKNNLVAWSHTIVGQSLAAGSPFEAFMVRTASIRLRSRAPPICRTRSPTFWSIFIRRATECRSSSGDRSGIPILLLSLKGSSMRWPMPQVRIRSNSGGTC